MLTGAMFVTPFDPLRVERHRTRPVHGVCVHTTGSGIYSHKDPFRWACSLYSTPGNNFSHYVIALDGETVQIADERVRAWHAGIDAKEHAQYAAGTWARALSGRLVAAWREEFPGKKSPLDLVPGGDPNEALIGVELVPEFGVGTFTQEQYESLAALVLDIWRRHELPLPISEVPGDGWRALRRQGRLVGHEDLEPLARWNSRGGWDPGGSHPPYKFSWSRLIAFLES